jgi:3-keto-5-aminohexanoate cleavage enzyme
MTNAIAIALAPTGGWGEGDNNPVTPEEISTEVIACARNGASILHLHARDRYGRLTADLLPFEQTISRIKEHCDIILEASTGGLSQLSRQERILPVTVPDAEMGSLNIGSLNFGDEVYQNSLPDVRYWIERMAAARVKPSLEIFDTGHLETALDLIHSGLVKPPCNFSFIFGVDWGMVYHRDLLDFLVGRLPPGSRWGAIFIGSEDFRPHLQAAAAGATVLRVGFEDSRQYGGRTAGSNMELVKALRRELEDAGYAVMTVSETRRNLLN